MRPIIYWLATGFLTFWGYRMLGGHIENIWQPTAFLMTIAPVICYFVYALSVSGTFKFVNRLFTGKSTEADFDVIQNAASLSFYFGAFAAVFSIINGMENGGNTGMTHAFYCILYGMMPNLLFVPFKHVKAGKVAKGLHLRSLGYAAATAALVIVGYMVTKH